MEVVLYQKYFLEETNATKMSHKKHLSPDIFMHIFTRQIFIYWSFLWNFGAYYLDIKDIFRYKRKYAVTLLYECCMGKYVWCHFFESAQIRRVGMG